MGFKNLGHKESSRQQTGGKSYYPMEGFVSVEDHYPKSQKYGHTENKEIAFEKAASDKKGAIKTARESVKDAVGKEHKKVKLEHKGFNEFDSGNYTHANAIHNVNAIGPTHLISKIKHYNED